MKSSKIEFGNDVLIFRYRDRAGLFPTNRRKKVYARDIEYITIERCVEHVWFKTYLSEKITIKTNRTANKIAYYGIAEFDNFEDYKNGLRIFARNNNVALRDMVRL